jgi:protease I
VDRAARCAFSISETLNVVGVGGGRIAGSVVEGLRSIVKRRRFAKIRSAMSLNGKTIALLVDNMYQEMEVWYPLYRLREAGVTVVTVGAKAGTTYTSKLGYPVVADKSYDEVSAGDFDGVVIPGGFAPDHIRRYPKAIQLVREINDAGKLVAAICHALWVPCSAGILKGRRVTSFFAIKDDVVNAGGIYEDSEVVVDGNLVSSRKPDDLPAFCRAAIEVLSATSARAARG